jgi:hypothetical protein
MVPANARTATAAMETDPARIATAGTATAVMALEAMVPRTETGIANLATAAAPMETRASWAA